MTQPFVMPEPGRRRWCDDPDGARALPAPTYPRRPRLALVTDAAKKRARASTKNIPAPQPEEPTRSVACPPTTSGAAPRAAMPTISQAVPSAAPTGARASSSAEGGIGVPGAGPGARAAEPSAAESKARRRARPVAAPSGSSSDLTTRGTPRKSGPKGGRPPSILLRWGERELSITAWANEPDVRARGLGRETIKHRLQAGWSIEKTLSTPADATKRRRNGVAASPEETARRREAERAKKARWRAKQAQLSSEGNN